MPIPLLTSSDRSDASQRAVALRRERARLLNDLSQSRISLAEMLERKDDVVGRIRARRLLEALPGIGPARSLQLIRQAGIAESRRVAGIGPRQKERLLALLASP
ncbi:integration host factor, actinobacterial type [Streptomyces sp. NPDC056480]|uniref:integration host factor, actinobacterial type n=1 Tax=Streptomyces sp. NPDC056480 TaxID=3345833 RepID=UPI00369F8A31